MQKKNTNNTGNNSDFAKRDNLSIEENVIIFLKPFLNHIKIEPISWPVKIIYDKMNNQYTIKIPKEVTDVREINLKTERMVFTIELPKQFERKAKLRAELKNFGDIQKDTVDFQKEAFEIKTKVEHELKITAGPPLTDQALTILLCLVKMRRPMTPQEIADKVNLSWHSVRKYITPLVGHKLVTYEDYNKRPVEESSSYQEPIISSRASWRRPRIKYKCNKELIEQILGNQN